ncbi:MAG TPA: DsrE family protein [Kofleriaceae bacterium]|nr:DsrE family protein [Kofleriaceae bacterium]
MSGAGESGCGSTGSGRPRRLTIVVSTAAECGDLDAAFELARAACACGVYVSMFFMSDAVAGLPQRRAELTELTDDGCELAVCAASAAAAGLGEAEIGLPLGGQDDHAAMVSRADRVVAFT